MSSTGWSALGKPPETTPGQGRDQPGRLVAGDRGALVEPEPGADLGHAGHGHAEQVGLRLRQVGVLADHLGDRLGAVLRDLVDPLADGDLVGQVGLEHEPERRAVAGHELEVRGDGRGDPLLVVAGRGQRLAHERHELAGVLVQQGEVEVELAREVLVQNGFGHPGPLGDLVHGRGVVARPDEDLLGRLEQLGAAGGTRQADATAAGVRGHRHVSVLLPVCSRAGGEAAGLRGAAAGAVRGGCGQDESHPTRG